MEKGGAVRSIDGVARRGLTGTEGVVVVGLCHRGAWPVSASGSGICVVGAEDGSGADNSSSRRRGSSLVRTKGRGANQRRGCGDSGSRGGRLVEYNQSAHSHSPTPQTNGPVLF